MTALPPPDREGAEVGAFEQGSPVSRWALGRYLVGRAIGKYVSDALLVFGLIVLAVAVVVWFFGPHWLAIVIGVVALCVFGLCWLVRAALRRITGARYFGPVADQVGKLVHQTRGDMHAELRRIGLPSRAWTAPLLVLRLIRPTRRAETLKRLSQFDPERVVPRSRLDELHMLVRQARPPR